MLKFNMDEMPASQMDIQMKASEHFVRWYCL